MTAVSKNQAGRRPKATGEANQEEALAFYRHVLESLAASGLPFLVGGGYALERHTGIERDRWDFDVFVLPEDARRILALFAAEGHATRLTYPHWLGKIFHRGRYVDVIFNSGNGVVRVDQAWFQHATRSELFGRQVLLCPIEEMIWSKAFVMERERFDGADVHHLIRTAGPKLDWARLVERFGSHWRVLLSHLVMFGFVYPQERSKIPEGILRDLVSRTGEPDEGGEPVCMGTLLSRTQYLPDLAWGYRDGRLVYGIMSPEDIARWTAAAKPK